MADTPHRSVVERGLHKISKRIKDRLQSPDGESHITAEQLLTDPHLSPNLSQSQETSMQHRFSTSVPSSQPLSSEDHTTRHSTSLAWGVMDTTKSKLAHKIKTTAKGTLWVLSRTAEGLPIPGAKAIFDVITKVIEVIDATQGNQEGLKALEAQCQKLMDTVLRPLKGKGVSEIAPALQDSLHKLESDLNDILAKVEQKLNLSKPNQIFNHVEHTAIIRDMNEQIRQFLDLYIINIDTWTMIMIQQIHHRQVLMQLKQDLHQASAGYDSMSTQGHSSCFPGTREALLHEIKSWIHDLNSHKSIYVLYGIAGIGKTTVAQTVAEYATSKGLLGASFFFSRAEESRKSGDHFFSTLASQLAQYSIPIADQIASALHSFPGAPTKALAIQINQLIIKPIQKAKLPQSSVILVIDAVDECLPAHAKVILELLANNIEYIPNFKVFLTTRPEPHIQKVLTATNHLHIFHLHEIEQSIAKGDIELYLKHSLSKDQVVKILQFVNWGVTEEHLAALVDKCGIMFIMASTAVKYILDEALNDPLLQITQLLNGMDIKEGDKGVMSSLDKMYLNILKSSVPERKPYIYLERFQKVVGTIIVLKNLLPTSSLAHLLGMEELHVKTTLQSLHSIMAPGSINQAPQVYHKSFPDFITDKERCIDVNFYIVPEVHHALVAELCFNTMDNLHANMPGLQGIKNFASNAEMGDSRTRNITSELSYACVHWADHLSQAGNSGAGKLLRLLHGFAFTHLLHWIEVLSLIGKLEVVCPVIKLVQQVIESWNVQNSGELQEILNDASRCITRFYEVIKASAIHIYYSALPFVPQESQLYKIYKATDSITVVKGQEDRWNPALAALINHSSIVGSVAFSPDGSWLASGSSDKTVRLWDGVTGAHTRTLKGHSNGVWSVVFSPDGSRVASGSDDKTVRLWDVLTGDLITILKGHLGAIQSLVFSLDGSRLASGSLDKTICLWNGFTGAYIATLEGHSGTVKSLGFSQDGSRLASGSDDKTLRLWNGFTGTHIATMEGHSHSVWNVVFSSPGFRLASGSFDKTLRLWDGFTGVHTATLEGHLRPISTIAFSPDGSRLASGSFDKTVRLWDGITGAHIATLEGHSDIVQCLVFSPDDSRVASGSFDKTVRLWDGITGAHITTMMGHSGIVQSLDFSPDGSKLASGSSDTTVRLWDGFTSAYVTTLEDHSSAVLCLAFSPDGSRLACGSLDTTARLWDGISGAYIATLKGHSHVLLAVSFSYENSRLATASGDKTIRLWNGSTGVYITTLYGHLGGVYCLVYSPNSFKLASGSDDNTVRLWDGLTGACIVVLEGHSNSIRSVAFSSDGSRLASGSYDTTVRLWDAYTEACIATLTGHSSRVHCLRFSPDSSRLASGSSDRTVRIWNALTGNYITELEGSNKIVGISFSSDGSKLVSTEASGIKKLWDPFTGNRVFNIDSTFDEEIKYMLSEGAIRLTTNNLPVLWLPFVGNAVFKGVFVAFNSPNGHLILLNTSQLSSLYNE